MLYTNTNNNFQYKFGIEGNQGSSDDKKRLEELLQNSPDSHVTNYKPGKKLDQVVKKTREQIVTPKREIRSSFVDKIKKAAFVATGVAGLAFAGGKTLEIGSAVWGELNTPDIDGTEGPILVKKQDAKIVELQRQGFIDKETAELLHKYITITPGNITGHYSREWNKSLMIDNPNFVNDIRTRNYKSESEAGKFLRENGYDEPIKLKYSEVKIIINQLEAKNQNDSIAENRIKILRDYILKYKNDLAMLSKIETRQGREEIYRLELQDKYSQR